MRQAGVMLSRATLMARQVWAQLEGYAASLHWKMTSPLPIGPLNAPKWIEKSIYFASTILFIFPLVLFFFFLSGKALFSYCLVCSVIFIFCSLFSKTSYLTLSSLKGRVDVCQEGMECCSLFQKGSRSQEWRAQLEISQAQRGKSRRRHCCKGKLNLQRQASPKRIDTCLKRHILNLKETKMYECTGEKIRLNISQQLWQKMRCLVYNQWTPWLCQFPFLINMNPKMKNEPRKHNMVKKEQWTGTQKICMRALILLPIPVCLNESLTIPVFLFLEMQLNLNYVKSNSCWL